MKKRVNDNNENGKYHAQIKSLHCRMYKNEYPKRSSLVYVIIYKYNK